MAVPRLIRVAALAAGAMVLVACGGPVPAPAPSQTPLAPAPSIPTVEVPSLKGAKRTEAVQAVLALGLNVRVVPLGHRAGQPVDRVAQQVPLAGSRVPPGAEVTLAAYCRPKPCPSPPPGRTIYDPCSCATRT
ncbi:MAG TPA: PASTA domain-containing protein [Actinomycetota bacterium]|nr:PASTA domain-containing protein [Actinomycetota bacterium]